MDITMILKMKISKKEINKIKDISVKLESVSAF